MNPCPNIDPEFCYEKFNQLSDDDYDRLWDCDEEECLIGEMGLDRAGLHRFKHSHRIYEIRAPLPSYGTETDIFDVHSGEAISWPLKQLYEAWRRGEVVPVTVEWTELEADEQSEPEYWWYRKLAEFRDHRLQRAENAEEDRSQLQLSQFETGG